MYLRPIALALALVATGGCGSQQQKCGAPRIWSGPFATCASADLGKIVASTGQNVQQSVSDAVADDPVGVDVALNAIAFDAGVDAINCAIAAIESSVPRALDASAEAFYPGLRAARAWLERHLTSSGRSRS